MNTTDKIMALANTYAASYGKALLEKLYGTSQSYTEQCEAEAFKNREAMRTEIEALVRDAERYRWLRNEADYLRLPQGSPQVLMTDEWGEPISTGKEAYPQKDGLDAAIDTAMQEKQS